MKISELIKEYRKFIKNLKNKYNLKDLGPDFNIDVNKNKKMNEITILIDLNINLSDFGYKYFFINLLKNDEILREYLDFFMQNEKEIKSILKEKENRTNLLFNLIKQKNEKIKKFLENKMSLKHDENEKQIVLIETIHFLNKFSFFLLEKDFYEFYNNFNINDYKKLINKDLYDRQIEQIIKESNNFLENLIKKFNETNLNQQIINYEINAIIKTNKEINEVINKTIKKKIEEKKFLNNENNNNQEELKELYYI